MPPPAGTQPGPVRPPGQATPGQGATSPTQAQPAPVPPPAGTQPGPVTPPGQAVAPPPGGGAPPVPGERRRGLSPAGAAAIGLGVGVLGGVMATQGAERFDDIRRRREERREGDVTIIREPGRTIIRDDDRVIIQRDETQRFRDLGFDGRTERRDGLVRTVFERPDGTRVVTWTDEQGRLVRRTRIDRDDREVVIIDNSRRDGGPGRFSDDIIELERPPLRIPRERYIVDAESAEPEVIYEALTAPPLAPLPRRYTLDEVRYSPDLRARMRSVDVDSVTFETGAWLIDPSQVRNLQVIANQIRRALQASANEVFLVEGHTDAVGPDLDNLSLSDRRAQSVAEILTKDFGIPPENLTTQGYGEQYLKVNTQAAERENRRVTIRRITPLINGAGG